jgi:hypothetical protein
VRGTVDERQPPGYRGINRRSHFTPEPVDMPAEILIPGATPRECRTVDLSDTGARLSVESLLSVPEEFDVRANGETGRVKVVRRGVRFLAVTFA